MGLRAAAIVRVPAIPVEVSMCRCVHGRRRLSGQPKDMPVCTKAGFQIVHPSSQSLRLAEKVKSDIGIARRPLRRQRLSTLPKSQVEPITMGKPNEQQLASQVRVGVRVRPLTSIELRESGKNVLKARNPEVRIGERRFTYDTVFDAAIGQSELYGSVSPPLLKTFLEGYNATVGSEEVGREISYDLSNVNLRSLPSGRRRVHNRLWRTVKLAPERRIRWGAKRTRNYSSLIKQVSFLGS